MNEWQPIETAPTDGTPVLLTWAQGNMQGHIMQGRFDGEWLNMAGGSLDKFGRMVGLGSPTHWFPIPSMPGQGRPDQARMIPIIGVAEAGVWRDRKGNVVRVETDEE